MELFSKEDFSATLFTYILNYSTIKFTSSFTFYAERGTHIQKWVTHMLK